MTKKTLSQAAPGAPSAALSPLAPSLIRKPFPPSSSAARDTRAYAKLLGSNGRAFYMTGFSGTFGRGPGVDFVVSNDVAISRAHARIEYSSESQAFELTVLGKNGAYVNGVYMRKSNPPRSLASQTEIVFGKANPVTLIFLLPCGLGLRDIVNKPQQRRPRSLLFIIGAVILGSATQRLSAEEIQLQLRRQYSSFVASVGPTPILESSIRHALMANQHLFHTHAAADLEGSVHAADVEMLHFHDTDKRTAPMPAAFKVSIAKVSAAKFSVIEKHAARFLGDQGHALGPPVSDDFPIDALNI